MSMEVSVKVAGVKLSDSVLGRGRARLKHNMLREILGLFKKAKVQYGLTQQQVADRLGVDKSVISRRLSGEDGNMTLETIADMLTAMNARMKLHGELFSEVKAAQENLDIWSLYPGRHEDHTHFVMIDSTLYSHSSNIFKGMCEALAEATCVASANEWRDQFSDNDIMFGASPHALTYQRAQMRPFGKTKVIRTAPARREECLTR